MRRIRTGNNSEDIYNIEIVVPCYINAIWCKDCETISILKNTCEKCGSTNVYHILQKQWPEEYKELDTCKYNKRGRIAIKNEKER